MLPLASCGDDTATAAASTSSSAAISPSTPSPSTPSASTPATGSSPADTSEQTPQALALEYLRARAAGDADASWSMLSPAAQQSWPDRATFDTAVGDGAASFTTVLGVDPTVTTGEVGDAAVTTLSGTADPTGDPRVFATTVLVAPDGVQASSPDSVPAAEWVNPTFVDAGSLGVGAYDPSAPLSVTWGTGTSGITVLVDGAPVPAGTRITGSSDGGSTATVDAPTLAVGAHVITSVVETADGPVSSAAIPIEIR